MNQSSSDPTLTGLFSGREGKWNLLNTIAMYCTLSHLHLTLVCRAETGFNHVEPEKYEPRLLHFKGSKVRTSLSG